MLNQFKVTVHNMAYLSHMPLHYLSTDNGHLLQYSYRWHELYTECVYGSGLLLVWPTNIQPQLIKFITRFRFKITPNISWIYIAWIKKLLPLDVFTLLVRDAVIKENPVKSGFLQITHTPPPPKNFWNAFLKVKYIYFCKPV